jgi:hypothetical protein
MPPNTPSLIGQTSFARVSTQTPGSAIAPAYAFGTTGGSLGVATSDTSLGFFSSGVSTIAVSYGTFSLNQARLHSIRTIAGSTLTASAAGPVVADSEAVFTVTLGSGASLALRSGGTVWIFNSAVSAAIV